ncbi:MAG: GSU2403 family nucleotidyltransferase fold protein [Gammaproteobacteria bacterium]|nr:GSU2403 family nucleotidyltransferase fold protein [Gammaproteobacteria bacterium]
MEYLPETTHLLYSQLLSQCLHASAPGGKGISFVSKRIKNTKQWYLQLTVGSQKTQHYVGPDSQEVQNLISNEKQLWEKTKPDRKAREQLVAMLIKGGAQSISAAEGRVFELIERAGAFLVGGVLVGSHAFSIYGNMLGVCWPTKITRTHDVDIARDNHIALGLRNEPVDLKQALLDAEMGFVEVPALNRKSPSTSFRIQGKQLSVDLLTPMIGKPLSKPVLIAAMNTYAEPVRFLDYLLDDVQPAVIVARGGILINVPSPARFALHKLVTSNRRPVALQTKTMKDIDQAHLLLSVLLEDRPGDIPLAIEAAKNMPDKFLDQMKSGLKKLPNDLAKKLSLMLN